MTASDRPDLQAEEALLIEAAGMVPLETGYPGSPRRRAFEAWRDQSPAHRAAGDAAERMLQVYVQRSGAYFEQESAAPRLTRRQWLGRAALGVAVVGAAGVGGSYVLPWREWLADYHTGVGARREVVLQDGSVLILNTDTSVDVRFDATRRTILLTRGEISVRVAPDRALAARPFVVVTAQGQIDAASSHFAVRQDEGRTRVAVLSGSATLVDKRPGAAGSRMLLGGWQTTFGPGVDDTPPVPADNRVLAWTHGLLIAQDMQLHDVAAELTRYRRGVVRCAADVADLRVTGVFPVEDTDRVLGTLQTTYPIRTRYVTRYWVELVSR